VHACHSSSRKISWATAMPVTEGQAVQALRLRLVPLQVRVQHEAHVRVGVVEQQPVHFSLHRCCRTVSAACAEVQDQPIACRRRNHAKCGLPCCHERLANRRFISSSDNNSLHGTARHLALQYIVHPLDPRRRYAFDVGQRHCRVCLWGLVHLRRHAMQLLLRVSAADKTCSCCATVLHPGCHQAILTACLSINTSSLSHDVEAGTG